MEKELDCRGLQCPEPVARCKKMLAENQPDALKVLVSNQAALENVKRFLERNGHATEISIPKDGEWQISATRTSTETTSSPSGDAPKTLVLITTETLGRGDDALGAKLMATFLASLPELGSALWRIILLNGGVKLSSKEGEALEHLKKLASSGVEILVCGTCLMHYGLMEKKEVGETTNMMDVVTSMALAEKIIRP